MGAVLCLSSIKFLKPHEQRRQIGNACGLVREASASKQSLWLRLCQPRPLGLVGGAVVGTVFFDSFLMFKQRDTKNRPQTLDPRPSRAPRLPLQLPENRQRLNLRMCN